MKSEERTLRTLFTFLFHNPSRALILTRPIIILWIYLNRKMF
uniref:Uncharacterized protein n=1 Tax=Triticum urartu TaxID=4572 RepID=A0A8R7P2Z6_TRIUA